MLLIAVRLIPCDPPQAELDEEKYAAWPRRKFGDMQLDTVDEPSSNCSICLDEFNSNDSIVVCPCHSGNRGSCQSIFHEDCAKPWFSRHATCPLCRAPFDIHKEQPAREHDDDQEANELQSMLQTVLTEFFVGQLMAGLEGGESVGPMHRSGRPPALSTLPLLAALAGAAGGGRWPPRPSSERYSSERFFEELDESYSERPPVTASSFSWPPPPAPGPMRSFMPPSGRTLRSFSDRRPFPFTPFGPPGAVPFIPSAAQGRRMLGPAPWPLEPPRPPRSSEDDQSLLNLFRVNQQPRPRLAFDPEHGQRMAPPAPRRSFHAGPQLPGPPLPRPAPVSEERPRFARLCPQPRIQFPSRSQQSVVNETLRSMSPMLQHMVQPMAPAVQPLAPTVQPWAQDIPHGIIPPPIPQTQADAEQGDARGLKRRASSGNAESRLKID